MNTQKYPTPLYYNRGHKMEIDIVYTSYIYVNI